MNASSEQLSIPARRGSVTRCLLLFAGALLAAFVFTTPIYANTSATDSQTTAAQSATKAASSSIAGQTKHPDCSSSPSAKAVAVQSVQANAANATSKGSVKDYASTEASASLGSATCAPAEGEGSGSGEVAESDDGSDDPDESEDSGDPEDSGSTSVGATSAQTDDPEDEDDTDDTSDTDADTDADTDTDSSEEATESRTTTPGASSENSNLASEALGAFTTQAAYASPISSEASVLPQTGEAPPEAFLGAAPCEYDRPCPFPTKNVSTASNNNRTPQKEEDDHGHLVR